MRACRLLAACCRHPPQVPSLAGNVNAARDVPQRVFHCQAPLHSLRKKVVPAFNNQGSGNTAESTPASNKPVSPSANSTAQPAPTSISPSSTYSSDPTASISSPSARSDSSSTASSSSSARRSPPASGQSSSRPAHRRAGAVTALRSPRSDARLIAHARKADDNADDPSYDWRMGLIVERLPTVLNPYPQWEAEWERHQDRKEARTAVPIPDGLKPQAEPEADSTPIDVDTADDAADNRQSLDRRARDSLYLLVRKSYGQSGDSTWTFPSVRYTALPFASETPKAAATSSIRYVTGDSLSIHTLGNAPVGYHRYEYSAAHRAQSKSQQSGAKLFLFHALYLGGAVDLGEQRPSPTAMSQSRYAEYVWVPRSQLHEYLSDRELQSLSLDVLMTDADYADETDVAELQRQQEERQRNIVYPQRQDVRREGRRGAHDRAAQNEMSATPSSPDKQRQHNRVQQAQ